MMAWLWHGFFHTFLLTLAIRDCLTFNVDLRNGRVYTGERDHFFGYKVLQFMSGTNKGIIVSAPLNGSGAICKTVQFETMECTTQAEISLQDKTFPVKHFGLSVIKDSAPSRFTACSPHVAHECNENSYLNSVCYNMTDDLQLLNFVTPVFQDCTKQQVDLIFLFDGSGSMTESEFNENKNFIIKIMKSLNGTSFKFAAVQFSAFPRKVFDFNEYQAGTALEALKKEIHMKDLTNTHRALKFVLEELIENRASGSSPDSTKVVVLITDGDPTDFNDHIIEAYDEKHIIRFVIGVKFAKIEKFRNIASEPKDNNTFKIENYDGLPGILENFQKRIFKMEGSQTGLAEDLFNEMAQSGFSGVSHNDVLILGSVGSQNWKGSIHELRGLKTTQIDDPLMQMDSYLGYSVSVGERNSSILYFAGAPRSEHKGQVVLFKYSDKKWTVADRVSGDQIGCYFGAELCSFDVNADGNTDFLLVGAPLYYQSHAKREGQIYVYRLTEEIELKSEVNMSVASMGRFGTSITSVADLNGDGLRDIAVGAPLEDDNRGAVYIFLGDAQSGIRRTFSQRIRGQKFQQELRFFGQAIDGDLDLGDDGLPDIVIGSQGAAVVIRSKPVFDVTAHLYFEPKMISIENISCPSRTDQTFQMGVLKVCFHMAETTKSKAGILMSGLNIFCNLTVDPMRQAPRGFFKRMDTKARTQTTIHELLNRENCFTYPIYMTECVKDTLSPISISLGFSQVNDETSQAALNIDSRKQLVFEVPFEKQCRKNDSCIAELEVNFTFTSQTLLVAEDSYFHLFVQLFNHGDNSYNTSLTLFYPLGLSFSMMTLTEQSRATVHMCHDLVGVLDRTTCSINQPVFHSRSSAAFNASFSIMTDENWNDSVSLTITGTSDNVNPNRTSSVTKSIPVQFQVKMAITVKEDTVSYVNFTTEDMAPKRINIIFQIDNPGWKAFPVNVSFNFPTKLEHNFEMTNYQVFVEENRTQCADRADTKTDHPCSENSCSLIMCDGFILDKESATEFRLSGDVHFGDLRQKARNLDFLQRLTGQVSEVTFRSFIHVNYDTNRYVSDSDTHKALSQHAEVKVEFIIPPDHLLIISAGAGLGLLLLIIITVVMWKLGCFKRKSPHQFEEEEPGQDGTSPVLIKKILSQSETEYKLECPPEEKSLLDDTKGDVPNDLE